MNKRGLSIGSLMVLFVCMMVIVILAMSNNKVDTSTIDKTIDSLNWSIFYQNISASFDRLVTENPSSFKTTMLTIANKAIDFYGTAVMEVAKFAMIFAKENPKFINYKVLLTLVILFLIAPVIYPLFMVTVSIILIIKEWYLSRKEKKELEKLK